jgi:hypothetical protein
MGLIASSTSYFDNATTTGLTTTNLWQAGQAAGCAQYDSNGKLTSTSVLCINNGTTTAEIWIDSNRTDSYTATGALFTPFKTITAANTYVSATTYARATYHIAPGSYSEQSMTLPNIPLVIYGNNANIVVLNGASVVAVFCREYNAPRL